jgi:hypothetical protein
MKTRDIILVGAGVVVGYLLVAYLKKSKDDAQETIDSVEPMVDQAKIDKCNEEVSLLMQTAKFKFSSPKAEEDFKKQAFEQCMAKNA